MGTLENLIFELLGVLDVESGLKPSKRGLTSDCFFNFLQDFQAILYHKLYCLLREIIHLLGADPEEGLPVKFVETDQPRLFSSEELDAGSLLLSQKLIQRKGGAAGVAEIPAHFPIDRVLGAPRHLVTITEIRFKLSVVKTFFD